LFNLFTGNDAAVLAHALGERLRAQVRGNPLVPARVLVPQAGLRRWLQVHLAERAGVVANVEFTPPALFAWELLRAAQPDLPRRSPFDPEVLRWHLHALLGEPLEGAALAPLRDYLARDGDPLRRYALSGELARVYERMQGYRREKLLRWEHSELNRGGDHGGWQAELWRRLVARVGGASRAARVEKWLRDFDPGYRGEPSGDKPAPPGLPAHVHAFACANISPDVLRMLGVAARHCELDFHLPLPSREYLGDTPRSRREVRARLREKDGGNPLVTSLGGAAAEFLELLYGYEHVQPDTEVALFDRNGIRRDTLLGRVRDDILAHRCAGDDARVALPDDTIQFLSSHTILREVQTLHDRLLAMFDADPALKPRDIAVMMPDVAAYRAAIEAVFGGVPEQDARFIPYNLGDVAAGAAHPAAHLFLTLLDAPTSRWECSEILDVLAGPGVMRRFDLDADELEQLSRQLRDAGVRWGEDERARARVGGYREFSFAFGLDRILAGFACGDDDEALVAGVAPLAGVEGRAFARMDALLAVLAAFRRLREVSTREMSAVEWQRTLNALFDGLYAGDGNDIAESRALERVRGALEDLVEHTQAASVQALPWCDVRAFMRERLNEADPRQQLFSGGVTFCGMVPLRVVPFRVVCLLGMDEAAFPRRDPSGLDPLTADRRARRGLPGDRSVREDDRLLFLQLIAAARDTLYISWVGRDAHSNETLATSVVVAELMDMLREDYLSQDADARDAREALLPRVQPLHPFDAALFEAAAPRSYGKEWLAAADAPEAEAAIAPFVPETPLPPVEAAQATKLTLLELRLFLLDPARGFLQHGLGLVLPRGQRDDADDEPLAPIGGLTRWNLVRALLAFGEGNASGNRDLLRARGQLPPGALGDEALRDAHVLADSLRAAVLSFTNGAAPLPAENLCVDWEDGTRLEGVPGISYPAGVLHVRPGKIDGRQVLHAWLDALLVAAAGLDRRVMLVGLDDEGEVRSFEMPRLARATARGQLRALIELHARGRRAPLPFFVRTSWDHAVACAQGGDAFDTEMPLDNSVFEKAAQRAMSENDFGGPGEFESDAVCIAWRGRDLPGGRDGELALSLHRTALAVFAHPAHAWVEQFS